MSVSHHHIFVNIFYWKKTLQVFFQWFFKNFLNNSGWSKFFTVIHQQMLLIRILCLLYYSLGHLISMSLYIIVNIAVIFMVMYDHNKLLFFVLHITQCVKKLFNGIHYANQSCWYFMQEINISSLIYLFLFLFWWLKNKKCGWVGILKKNYVC